MFDAIVQTIAEYPYLGVALVFLLCGMGLPLPEEIVLIAGGYVCAKFPEQAALPWMMLWSAGAILTGDSLPYVLGRVFGTRLLRLRWLRILINKRRLAKFDQWFRQRGDLVIFIARFLAGIRMVAFFTAGTMKMPVRRFLLLDVLGIVLIVPLLIWIGYGGASVIDDVVAKVQRVERGILWSVGAGVVLLVAWFWFSRSRRRRRAVRVAVPKETFVEPRVQPRAAPDGDEAAAPEPAPEPAPDHGRAEATAPEELPPPQV